MLSAAFLFFLLLQSTTALEVDDETEFDYIKGSEKGPERWGLIKEEWASCKTGKLQSPIDLLHRRVQVIPKAEDIIKFYNSGNSTVKNRGHDIMVSFYLYSLFS
ncbi:Alpha carbonic anhydrase 7 [Bienertia sinuspersici]